MPRIHFLNDDLEIEVEPGTSVARAAMDAGASLPFGCRAGTCATCVLRVVEGADGIAPPGFVELDTLTVVDEDGPGKRLGCQILLGRKDLSLEW